MMKQLYKSEWKLRVLFCTFGGVLLTNSVVAEEFQLDGITYQTTADNACSVLRGKNEAQLVLPQDVSYSGVSYRVTSIADSAFYRQNLLTRIELPESIISIGNCAFYYCNHKA
jgi:hypothetical protein